MINFFGQSVGAAAAVSAQRPSLMELQNVTIRNVVVTGAKQAGKVLCGNGTHGCEHILLENVTMQDFAEGWACAGEVDGTRAG